MTTETQSPLKVPRVESSDEANTCVLLRDPGLCKQILDYTPNERQEIRSEYLKLKAFQPILDVYPYSEFGIETVHQRSFQSSWFEQCSWLEYSPSKDAAFCFPCFRFTNKPSRFTHDGFCNWKKVNSGKDCAFLTHVGKGPNSQHNKNQKACDDKMNKKQHIEPALLCQTKEEIQKNKKRLKTSIDVVRWLAFQSCPFRGHDESVGSKNQGNFLELIKLFASYDKDVENIVLQNAPGNASYTFSMIQKEILQVFASKVQTEIREEIGEGKFFSRQSLKRTNDHRVKEEIYKVMTYHNLNLENIRGQGYDGASNMQGEFNGLKALILKDSPYAYYVNFFAHRLQLALVRATKEVISIQQIFFFKLAFIINIVDASSKRRDELQAAQQTEIVNKIANEGVKTGRGLNQIGNLQRVVDTRWTSHLNSITSLIGKFSATGKVLISVIKVGNCEQRASADASYDTLMSFEFVFVLHLMRELLGLTNNLCQALQRRTQDIVNAMSLVQSTRTLIQNFRSSGWNDFFLGVKFFCEEYTFEILDMNALYTTGKGRSRQGGQLTMEHHYRVDLFMAAIDSQLQELDDRFDERVVELLILSVTLDPKDSFKSLDVDKICYLVKKYYPKDLSDQEQHQLHCELQHFQLDICVHMKFDKLPTLYDLCQALGEIGKNTTFCLVDKVIRLVLTLPVSTATCERAFSVMNIVKTQLMSKMEEYFLRDM